MTIDAQECRHAESSGTRRQERGHPRGSTSITEPRNSRRQLRRGNVGAPVGRRTVTATTQEGAGLEHFDGHSEQVWMFWRYDVVGGETRAEEVERQGLGEK
jgi:hypothetical protein